MNEEEYARKLHEQDVALYDYLAAHQDNFFEVGAKKYFKDESVVPEWVLKEIEEHNAGVDHANEAMKKMPVHKNPKFTKKN